MRDIAQLVRYNRVKPRQCLLWNRHIHPIVQREAERIQSLFLALA